MTCIVAIEHGGKVFMGGDSASVGGSSIQTSLNPKVVVVGDFIIGFCGSWRLGDILTFEFKAPPHPNELNDRAYIVTLVVDVFRKLFKEKGYGGKDKEGDSGGTFMLGYRGKIYTIYSDFQVNTHAHEYDATGSGVSYALGSLFSTVQYKNHPEWRIQTALRSAEEFCTGVRGPFLILSK